MLVADDEKLIVTDVRRTELIVSLGCLLDRLISCLIILIIILLCINSRRYHMDHRIVSIISQFNIAPAGSLEELSPFFVANVPYCIHEATITYKYRRLAHCLRDVVNIVFQSNLRLHKANLKRSRLLLRHLAVINHGACFHE